MSLTVQQILNDAGSATDDAVALSALRDTNGSGFGDMLASAFSPALLVRSGLTSSDTHIEDKPGLIHVVLDAAGTTELTMLHAVGAVAGAGEVAVTYTAGVATLVFGDGANTGYQVLKTEGPIGLAANLAKIFRS
jgi:hypothetical protein